MKEKKLKKKLVCTWDTNICDPKIQIWKNKIKFIRAKFEKIYSFAVLNEVFQTILELYLNAKKLILVMVIDD